MCFVATVAMQRNPTESAYLMTAQPAKFKPCLSWVVMAFVIAVFGCNPGSSSSPLPSDESESSANRETTVAEMPWPTLIGTWTGAAFPRVNKMLVESATAEKVSESRVDFLLEIEEKFLSVKGLETCHLTVTISSNNTSVASKRDFYRMSPDEKDPSLIALRGSSGDFKIKILEEGRLEIQGKSHLTKTGSAMRNLHAKLIRTTESPADPLTLPPKILPSDG